MKPLFTGTGTALITPFKNGEIDWDALDNLVESQIAGGVSALIAAGTTGEPSTMTWDEHIEVIRFVAERAKDRACVIAGTGSNCTREVIHAANVVKDFGVAAQLVVTPYYNKSTQEGLVAHYTEIAEKTSLPIVVYNVPSRTGVNIQPATLEKICRLPECKDDTDMLAAIKRGLELGYTDFRIYAATGGRFDHTLANIQCLLYLKNHGAVGYLVDGTGMVLVLQNEAVHFRKELEGTMSLFAMTKEAKGVNIRGMKYSLENAVITNDFPIGISNEFLGEEAEVSVEDGELVCMIRYYEDEV